MPGVSMKRAWIVCLSLLFAGCSLTPNDNTPPTLQLKEPAAYENPTVGYWARNLKDEDPELRLEAAQSLGEMGPDAREAVPVLNNTLLNDTDWRVRALSAQALGQIGHDANPAVPTLLDAMNDRHIQVARIAGRSLRIIIAPKPPAPAT